MQPTISGGHDVVSTALFCEHYQRTPLGDAWEPYDALPPGPAFAVVDIDGNLTGEIAVMERGTFAGHVPAYIDETCRPVLYRHIGTADCVVSRATAEDIMNAVELAAIRSGEARDG